MWPDVGVLGCSYFNLMKRNAEKHFGNLWNMIMNLWSQIILILISNSCVPTAKNSFFVVVFPAVLLSGVLDSISHLCKKENHLPSSLLKGICDRSQEVFILPSLKLTASWPLKNQSLLKIAYVPIPNCRFPSNFSILAQCLKKKNML